MIDRVLRPMMGDQSPTARLIYGIDVVDGLALLSPSSVHCVATSPPYWNMRDYGVAPQDWPEIQYSPVAGLPAVTTPPQRVALGLEVRPEDYVGHVVHVFRSIKRVLREDGVAWLNLGDGYASGSATGLAPTNLLLMPHRVALALQADGWVVRNDIVWSKSSCLPESVRNRCTRSHEYVFMLARGQDYFYDIDAIREPITTPPQRRIAVAPEDVERPGHRKSGMSYRYDGIPPGNVAGRNKRTVWTVNPTPYRGAHFACWPPKLVETMVLAGTSARGCCPTCGAPWHRVRRQDVPQGNQQPSGGPKAKASQELREAGGIGRLDGGRRSVEGSTFNNDPRKRPVREVSRDWEPGCLCVGNDGSRRPIILDSFSGSGTTGAESNRLGRDYIGIDLNEDYVPLAISRILGHDADDVEDSPSGTALDMFG